MRTQNSEKLAHSVADTMAVSGLGKTTVYRLIKRGQLEAVKVGVRTLITDQSLRDLLASAPRINA